MIPPFASASIPEPKDNIGRGWFGVIIDPDRTLSAADSMSHQISHPNLGLAIYSALCCCIAVAAFAAWIYGLLQPTRAQNPGLAAYKPPPATIVGYGPAVPLPAPPREALMVVEPG